LVHIDDRESRGLRAGHERALRPAVALGHVAQDGVQALEIEAAPALITEGMS